MEQIDQAVVRAFERTGRPSHEYGAFVAGWNATSDYKQARLKGLGGSNYLPLAMMAYMVGAMLIAIYAVLVWRVTNALVSTAWHIVPAGLALISLGVLAHLKARASDDHRARAFYAEWSIDA